MAPFPAPEALRLLRRLEFHSTPKHASWLNMAEIELSVLGSQCLARRITDPATLARETQAWQERRNRDGVTIKWRFTVHKARHALPHLYPQQS